MYGTKWCADTIRALKLVKEQGIDNVWIDITKNPEGEKLLERINHGCRSVPTIKFPDESIMAEPSNDQLKEKIRALNLDK